MSLIFSCPAYAAPLQTAEVVNEWRQAHEQQIVDGFVELLGIPNVAADTANIRRNANHISGLLKDAGLQVELLELEGSNPVVFAHREL
jgi:hypothetical protein